MTPIAPILAPERDGSFKRGRAKDADFIAFTLPGFVAVTTATGVTKSANLDHYVPFLCETPVVVDQVACEVTSGASGNLRMGIYRADSDLQPIGAPLLDSGNIAITAAVKVYTPGTPLFLGRGRYLTVLSLDTGGIQFRTWNGSLSGGSQLDPVSTGFLIRWQVSRSYAAFPTPGTAWTTTTSSSSTAHEALVLLRVSSP